MPENTIDTGPLKSLLDDPAVSEIMVNGPRQVFVERHGKKMLSSIVFNSEEEVFDLVKRIYGVVGKRVDKDVPCADVCMEDGTRVNVIIPPLARFGIAVTFRKFSKEIKTIEDLIRNGTLTNKAADFLLACVKGKINMIFSGGTGVGKTTTLQILSRDFAPEERVITIEDAAELKMSQENVISLETRTQDENGKGGVSIRDLIHNSLRMAPDRLVIGEVRGSEAIDMIQAMATGHSGTIGVVHGNSPRDVIARLETMVLMSGVALPLWEVRKLIASTVNLVVHHERLRDGSRKITQISEVRGMDKEEIILNDLFVFQMEKVDEKGRIIGVLKPSVRYYPLFFPRLKKLGLVADDIFVTG